MLIAAVVGMIIAMLIALAIVDVYGGGFVNVINGTVYEFTLPTWGEPAYQLYTFDGEDVGITNGCKGKFDYTGKQWGFAGSLDPVTGYITPTVVWRAAIDPGTHAITLDITDLPEINEDGDLPIPNQITVDNNGSIYFPGGAILDDNSYPVVIKGVVSEAPFAINYTITPVFISEQNPVKTLCASLNSSHTLLFFYLKQGGEFNDAVCCVSTTDFNKPECTILTGISQEFTGHYEPYNMETDANFNSPNYDYTFFIINTGTDYICIGVHKGGLPQLESNFCSVIIEIGDEPVTVDIDEGDLPKYYFTERKQNSPANNIVNRFRPTPGGGLTADGQRMLTQIVKMPTHSDTDRDVVTQDYYSGSAFGLTEPEGSIRRKASQATGAESDLAVRLGYQKIWVAGRRECYGYPVTINVLNGGDFAASGITIGLNPTEYHHGDTAYVPATTGIAITAVLSGIEVFDSWVGAGGVIITGGQANPSTMSVSAANVYPRLTLNITAPT